MPWYKHKCGLNTLFSGGSPNDLKGETHCFGFKQISKPEDYTFIPNGKPNWKDLGLNIYTSLK